MNSITPDRGIKYIFSQNYSHRTGRKRNRMIPRIYIAYKRKRDLGGAHVPRHFFSLEDHAKCLIGKNTYALLSYLLYIYNSRTKYVKHNVGECDENTTKKIPRDTRTRFMANEPRMCATNWAISLFMRIRNREIGRGIWTLGVNSMVSVYVTHKCIGENMFWRLHILACWCYNVFYIYYLKKLEFFSNICCF